MYANFYGVITEDMVSPMEEHKNFAEFFTRKVKPRTINPNPRELVSPADSKILSLHQITGDDVLLIKNVNYSLGEFLTGKKEQHYTAEELELVKKMNQKTDPTNLYSAIFYLSPGDYHRFHSPCDFTVKARKHIIGQLYPVKISYLDTHPRVYEENERVCLFGEWSKGVMTQVYVGATNVGSIHINREGDKLLTNKAQAGERKVRDKIYSPSFPLLKGEEVGMFRLGSTVVMIFEAPKGFQWSVKEGDRVRYGQAIGAY